MNLLACSTKRRVKKGLGLEYLNYTTLSMGSQLALELAKAICLCFLEMLRSNITRRKVAQLPYLIEMGAFLLCKGFRAIVR